MFRNFIDLIFLHLYVITQRMCGGVGLLTIITVSFYCYAVFCIVLSLFFSRP